MNGMLRSLGLVVSFVGLLACSSEVAPLMRSDASPAAMEPPPPPPSGGSESSAPEVSVERQVVVELDVELEVADLDAFREHLDHSLRNVGGHISDSNRGGRLEARHGRWTLRVPSRSHEAFLEMLGQAGEIVNVAMSSKDVTAELVDVDARLRSLRTSESRMLELVGRDTANLADVLAIERELARVRGEIESLEGRQRLVVGQVAMATIRLSTWQRSVYDPNSATHFGQRAARTLERSYQAAIATMEGFALFLISMLPWSPAIAAIVLFIVVRRRRRELPPSVR